MFASFRFLDFPKEKSALLIKLGILEKKVFLGIKVLDLKWNHYKRLRKSFGGKIFLKIKCALLNAPWCLLENFSKSFGGKVVK